MREFKKTKNCYLITKKKIKLKVLIYLSYNQMAEEIHHLFKIIIIGDAGVGKSNILLRYTKNEFDSANKPTIGIEFNSKTIEIEGEKVKMQIWDTAGQERYRAVAKQYYKGAAGVMVVYDITKAQSFENLSK